MARGHAKLKRNGVLSVALACSCGLLALGGTGIALAAVSNTSTVAATSNFAGFTPASVDPSLAQFVAKHAESSHLMRFTPAGTGSGLGRSITVAVRVDSEMARAISVRSAIASAKEQMSATKPKVELAPTRFDLGVARGYQSFAQAKPVVAILGTQLADIAMPDISEFRPSPGVKSQPSRFSAHIALEKDQRTGRAEGTLESLGEQTFDLGGAVRVTRNLDVRAGVRYSQDRDRMAPLTDGEQDSQAVYVGTQFRF